MPPQVRKVRYTRAASRLFWNLDAPRNVRLRALTVMRDLAGSAYPSFKRDRVKGHPDLCRYQFNLKDERRVHVFIVLFDDTTDPERLILRDWHHTAIDADDD